MAAKRYHSSNIVTNRGNTDVIEIWDEDFSGSSTEFRTGGDGYRLRQEGSSTDRFHPVTPTTLSFEMIIQNATHRDLIIDLTSSAEGRFKIKLTRNGSLRYAGTVLIDIGQYEDISYPYAFSVKASDLGTLATIDYCDNGTPYDGWETFIEHTIRALDKTGLPEFAWATGTMLSTTADWYEDSMTTGAAQDPLALTRNHQRAFYDVENTGSFKFMSTLDVLKQHMRIMGCNLKQSGGRFRIFQIPQYNNATVTSRHYDKDGAYLSNSSDTYTVTSDQTNTGARLAGGNYTWLAPLNRVKLTYKHRNWLNIINGQTLGSGVPWTGPDLVNDTNPFPLVASLRVQRTLINGSNPTGSPYFEKYGFEFKVGSYYLKRNLTQILNSVPQYEQATWTTTPSKYYFHFLNTGNFPALGGSGQLTTTHEFVIPAIPASGTSRFDATSEGFVNASGTAVGITFGAGLVVTGYVAMTDSAEATDTFYSVTNSTGSSNSVDYQMTTQIGAGTSVNSIGRLQVYNGSTWSDSNVPDGWTISGSGTEYILQDLLIREIMAGQAAPVEKMVTTIGYTNYEPHQRITDGTKIWAFLTGEYIAAMDDWQGEWYFIQRDPDAPTSTTPYEIPSDGGIFSPPKGGGVLNPQTPSGPSFPSFPSIPGIPGGYGSVGDIPPLHPIIMVGGAAGSQTTTAISTGIVTSIPVRNPLVANAYVAGQQISIIDPFTGTNQNFIVASNSVAGDTSIAVSGYAVNTLSPGSYVISTGINTTELGITPGSGTGGDLSDLADLFTAFYQWWTTNTTNDPTWPIQATDVGFETDENAGDGATAGLRFDGDGIQIFKSSSATATFRLAPDGKLYVAGLDTGTSYVALVIEGGYLKMQTMSAGVTDHGALTGLGDDDHTQYHNDARGDARYYTETELDAGQLDNRYFRENEHLNTSAGAGDAGKPIKLDAAGHVDATMINDADIDHGSIVGLSDDDHTIYLLLLGRAGGQTFYGGTAALESVTIHSTSHATKGRIILQDEVYLNTVNTGTSTSVLILESGLVKQKTLTVVTDHGALTGLGDDDHTQYVLLAGRSGGQTLYGGTASLNNLNLYSTSHATKGRIIANDDFYALLGFDLRSNQNAGNGSTAGITFLSSAGIKAFNASSSTAMASILTSGNWEFRSDPNAGNGSTAGIVMAYNGFQVFKSTSATTTVFFPTNGGWQFRSVPLVGNGSNAGVRITDTDGVQAYKSTSTTATVQISPLGTFILSHGGHPTISAGIMYVNSGVLYTDYNGAGSKVAAQYGHIKNFNVIGLGTNWAVGAKDVFWKITSEYAGHEVWQLGFGVGITGGGGASTNQCYCYHSNASGGTITTIYQMTCDTTASTVAAATNVISLTAGDYIYFNVSSIRATPAQGLYVELYLRKT